MIRTSYRRTYTMPLPPLKKGEANPLESLQQKPKAPADLLMDGVDWKPSPKPEGLKEGERYATHTGVVNIGGFEIECAVLDDGSRVFCGTFVEDLVRGLTE